MKNSLKIIAGVFLAVTFSLVHARDLSAHYVQLPIATTPNYTLLDSSKYHLLVKQSRAQLQQILQTLAPYRRFDSNEQLALVVKQFMDIPYAESGAMGEGDWQPTSITYQAGAVHIVQYPLYRLDGLNCQTFVQDAMAAFFARNLAQYDKTFLQIAYGAAGNPNGERVEYFNRNIFMDGDWNPVNERAGLLTDVTNSGALSAYTQNLQADITRQNWFNQLLQEVALNVNVLNAEHGDAMAKAFKEKYSHLNFPNFRSEKITMTYIPKTAIALKQADGSYLPNHELLEKIPTPAVLQIIRDPKTWYISGKLIKDAIGSELTVSHLGFIYRQTFKKGEVIYQKISCSINSQNAKVCHVAPVICEQTQCRKLMFAHATNGYPDGYYWYQQADKSFACTATLPRGQKHYSFCNRVNAIPLFDYLTNYQYGAYPYMGNPSLLGVHIEKLNQNFTANPAPT